MHFLVADQWFWAGQQLLIFLWIHFCDGNTESDFKKENCCMEIWQIFIRTELVFCFLTCNIRSSAETGSLLHKHNDSPAQRRRRLLVLRWPCPCTGQRGVPERLGENRRQVFRKAEAPPASGQWGRLKARSGVLKATSRHGPTQTRIKL